jgi:hypothetical protein
VAKLRKPCAVVAIRIIFPPFRLVQVKHLDRVADKSSKAKSRRQKLAFAWIDADRFAGFAAQFRSYTSERGCDADKEKKAIDRCRGGLHEPQVVAVIAKKIKFAVCALFAQCTSLLCISKSTEKWCYLCTLPYVPVVVCNRSPVIN